MTIKVIGLILLLSIGQFGYGQVDNYAKNSKLFDDEQTRFENEQKINKDSAEVYWKHGNVTASFTFIRVAPSAYPKRPAYPLSLCKE